jgi:hypothetical protein
MRRTDAFRAELDDERCSVDVRSMGSTIVACARERRAIV